MQRLDEAGIPLVIEKPIGMEGRFMSVIVAEDKVKSAALARERERAADGSEADTEAVASGQQEG